MKIELLFKDRPASWNVKESPTTLEHAVEIVRLRSEGSGYSVDCYTLEVYGEPKIYEIVEKTVVVAEEVKS